MLSKKDLALGARIDDWPTMLRRWNAAHSPAMEQDDTLPILGDFIAAQRNVDSQVEKLVARIAAIDREQIELTSEREIICAALQVAGRPLGEELLRKRDPK